MYSKFAWAREFSNRFVILRYFLFLGVLVQENAIYFIMLTIFYLFIYCLNKMKLSVVHLLSPAISFYRIIYISFTLFPSNCVVLFVFDWNVRGFIWNGVFIYDAISLINTLWCATQTHTRINTQRHTRKCTRTVCKQSAFIALNKK